MLLGIRQDISSSLLPSQPYMRCTVHHRPVLCSLNIIKNIRSKQDPFVKALRKVGSLGAGKAGEILRLKHLKN